MITPGAERTRLYYERHPEALERNNQLRRSYQARTLDKATRRGQEWTTAELDAVANARGNLAEVALQLGRTYAGVTQKSRQLRSVTG